MEEKTGTWRGEYRINFGTEEEPELYNFHFQVRIVNGEEGFTGKFKDLTLKTSDSNLHGFTENDFISFVRHTEPSKDLLDSLKIDTENEHPMEFIFNGNWNEQEELYQSYWEVEIETEADSFQSDVFVESKTGEWYLRKF